ncbi:MAG: UDP-N-acetylmuramoyl-L-alanine--D-glutamate ligase [Oribacterium sp.]|nr:UDP-N-acetylmuramoyl-L-alanine--D-glutamate ligase [Oribacterium sp.]
MESKKVLVLGTGKSGISAAKQIISLGGSVILYDSNEKLDPLKILKNFGRKRDKVSIVLGELQPATLVGVDLAVISPGIALDKPFVQLIDAAKIPIWGEIELAYQSSKGKLCAVTGTNGKTTTVSLIGEILKAEFDDVHVCGNIGNPFTAEALETRDDSVTVLEVSSFQLETIMDFHPHVSAITNITPDHLDRHKTMKNYIRVKESIALNQTEEDYVVLNYEDPELRKFGKRKTLKPKVVFFSSKQVLKEGFYYKDSKLHYAHDGQDDTLLDVHDLILLGEHNFENVMCAMAVTLNMGVPMDKIISVCKKFKPVEHRIEFVRKRNGVMYYNDSKGTNPDAAIKALLAMPGPVILIGGGFDKNIPFDDWCKLFPGRVKYLVLIGQTRNIIAECAKKYGFTNVMFAEDMDEAVKDCAAYADAGDYVLLSPACASWGMFKNYEERGRIFKDCVKAL